MRQADGVLLIGDRAIHAPHDVFPAEWDLGAEWCSTMGLPFVFAVWAARPGIDTRPIAAVLRRTRDAALGHLEQIAAAAAPEVGLDAATCLSYFRDNLHFYLGPREQQGLQLFLQHAADLGFVPRAVRVRLLCDSWCHDRSHPGQSRGGPAHHAGRRAGAAAVARSGCAWAGRPTR